MKAGSSSNSDVEAPAEGTTSDLLYMEVKDMPSFMSALAIAEAEEDPAERFIEAPRAILDKLTKGKGVGDTGYFFYRNVKVYEKGRRKECEARDALSAPKLAEAAYKTQRERTQAAKDEKDAKRPK